MEFILQNSTNSLY